MSALKLSKPSWHWSFDHVENCNHITVKFIAQIFNKSHVNKNLITPFNIWNVYKSYQLQRRPHYHDTDILNEHHHQNFSAIITKAWQLSSENTSNDYDDGCGLPIEGHWHYFSITLSFNVGCHKIHSSSNSSWISNPKGFHLMCTTKRT